MKNTNMTPHQYLVNGILLGIGLMLPMAGAYGDGPCAEAQIQLLFPPSGNSCHHVGNLYAGMPVGTYFGNVFIENDTNCQEHDCCCYLHTTMPIEEVIVWKEGSIGNVGEQGFYHEAGTPSIAYFASTCPESITPEVTVFAVCDPSLDDYELTVKYDGELVFQQPRFLKTHTLYTPQIVNKENPSHFNESALLASTGYSGTNCVQKEFQVSTPTTGYYHYNAHFCDNLRIMERTTMFGAGYIGHCGEGPCREEKIGENDPFDEEHFVPQNPGVHTFTAPLKDSVASYKAGRKEEYYPFADAFDGPDVTATVYMVGVTNWEKPEIELGEVEEIKAVVLPDDIIFDSSKQTQYEMRITDSNEVVQLFDVIKSGGEYVLEWDGYFENGAPIAFTPPYKVELLLHYQNSVNGVIETGTLEFDSGWFGEGTWQVCDELLPPRPTDCEDGNCVVQANGASFCSGGDVPERQNLNVSNSPYITKISGPSGGHDGAPFTGDGVSPYRATSSRLGGFDHSDNLYLDTSEWPDRVYLGRGTGVLEPFVDTSSFGVTFESRDTMEVIELSGTTYELTMGSGEVWLFEDKTNEPGIFRVTKRTLPNGVEIEYDYDDIEVESTLYTVLNEVKNLDTGDGHAFHYDGDGRIEAISRLSESNHRAEFVYYGASEPGGLPGELKSFTRPGGGGRSYTYVNIGTSNRGIETIRDAKGQLVSMYEYDADGRMVAHHDSDSVTHLSYVDFGELTSIPRSDLGIVSAIITNSALGHVTETFMNDAGQPVRNLSMI